MGSKSLLVIFALGPLWLNSALANERQWLRRQVATVDSGHVWWHGHKLSPPFVIDVEFSLDPDTTWRGVAINGLPYRLVPPAHADSGRTPPDERFTRRRKLTDQVFAERDTLGGMDALRQRQVAILRNHPELVDSARVLTSGTIRFYWRGDSLPDHLDHWSIGGRR